MIHRCSGGDIRENRDRSINMNFVTMEKEIGTTVPLASCDELPATPQKALAELVELLETYAPMWYTEELHNRAVSALQG